MLEPLLRWRLQGAECSLPAGPGRGDQARAEATSRAVLEVSRQGICPTLLAQAAPCTPDTTDSSGTGLRCPVLGTPCKLRLKP